MYPHNIGYLFSKRSKPMRKQYIAEEIEFPTKLTKNPRADVLKQNK